MTKKKNLISLCPIWRDHCSIESNLVGRVHVIELKSSYEIRNGNKEEGTAKVKHAIQILNDLGFS